MSRRDQRNETAKTVKSVCRVAIDETEGSREGFLVPCLKIGLTIGLTLGTLATLLSGPVMAGERGLGTTLPQVGTVPRMTRHLLSQDPNSERKLGGESSLEVEEPPTASLGLGETRTFEATAYALKGVTRNGVYVRRGVIAADPRILPLGSIVQLTSDQYSGVYRVHDTGGLIKGEIIDLWVPTSQEARQFGRRKVKIQVLKLGKRRARP